MTPSAIGPDEDPQLTALPTKHAGDLRFDGLITLASTTLNVPIAQVAFTGLDPQQFRTRYGVDAPEASGDAALLCGLVVAAGETLVVPDICGDERFSEDPPMVGDGPLRFYAGAPLRTSDGLVLGAFWVGDHAARTLTAVQLKTLALLADQVVEVLELRRAREAVDREANADAERAKTEFVSMVSHELRTPLTTIRGALGLVANGLTGTLPQQAQECVDIALANSERLVRLINDILDIEKIQSGTVELNLRPAGLAGIVDKAVRASRALTDSHDITLTFSDETADIEVLVDEDRLVQVLEKLISNAAKFSEAGQSVEISTAKVGDRVRVQVCDHGRGISQGFRKRVFERFAQEDSSATRDKGGTGLSLHIAKVLIEGMNGTMAFESVPGSRTTFFFELPVITRSAPDAEVVDIGPKPVNEERVVSTVRDLVQYGDLSQKPMRVLYVEDDRDLQQIVRRLMPMNWAFTGATTVAEGRALLDAHSFDLVLLDLSLPDGDGAELLDHAGSAQVVIFSASEAQPTLAGRVASALVKSRTTEFQLRDHVLELVASHEARRASP